jgi:pimeloyl-ACP methyl ester carboxylesterase
MKRYLLYLFGVLALLGGILLAPRIIAHAAASSCVTPNATNTLHGAIGGANYTIAVPTNWNGTLVLYSHGYTFANRPLANPAPDVGDAATGAVLLQQGYALAGSSYSQNGWALAQAFNDQIALLDFFTTTCGKPTRTIAWGHSLGGIITAGLIQLHPERFDAALPMCGVLSGGVGTWNQALDGSFAFNVLLAGGALPVVHIKDPTTAFNQAEQIIGAAQQTPQGRARIALAAALSDTPGWFDPASPEPAATDFAAQELNQFKWESQVDFAFAFFARAELEARAHGNPSWNLSVNYNKQLGLSAQNAEVKALYQQAGLNLDTDLKALNAAQRIVADPGAVQYLSNNIVFNGKLKMPVLTMHTTGDGLVVNQNEQTYAQVVRSAGNNALLREIFVHRAGHCTFTPAETLTAFQTLIHRLDTGKWDGSVDPALLNQEAAALGPALNVAPPAFLAFTPTQFLRPFTRRL